MWGTLFEIRKMRFLFAIAAFARADDSTPYFTHLALSSDASKMHVSWRTNSSNSSLNVAWGLSPTSLTQGASGLAWTFTDSTQRAYYLHRATLVGLTPGSRYFYRVGGAGAVSSFLATRAREQFSTAAPLRIAWLGDLGYTNGQALSYLVKEAAAGTFDHYVHVGVSFDASHHARPKNTTPNPPPTNRTTRTTSTAKTASSATSLRRA